MWSFSKGRWPTRHGSNPSVGEGDPPRTPSTHRSQWDIKLKGDNCYRGTSLCSKRKFEGGMKVKKESKVKTKGQSQIQRQSQS